MNDGKHRYWGDDLETLLAQDITQYNPAELTRWNNHIMHLVEREYLNWEAREKWLDDMASKSIQLLEAEMRRRNDAGRAVLHDDTRDETQ